MQGDVPVTCSRDVRGDSQCAVSSLGGWRSRDPRHGAPLLGAHPEKPCPAPGSAAGPSTRLRWHTSMVVCFTR